MLTSIIGPNLIGFLLFLCNIVLFSLRGYLNSCLNKLLISYSNISKIKRGIKMLIYSLIILSS